MIEFLTLFLGLTVGPQVVELNVNGAVATVAIQLDGKTIHVLEKEPWTFECDLGEQPLPHDLVAIAMDKDGEEIDRAELWINMGSNRSRASLAIQTDPDGRARALRLNWESIGEERPREINVVFDGKPLVVSDPNNIPLPSHDGDEFHYVSASLEFDENGESRRETELGGIRSQEISSELTAIVVDLAKRVRLPSVTKMRTWFLKRGVPVPIHGVEKGLMEVFIVRSPGAQEVLDRLASEVVSSSYTVNSGVLGPWIDWQPEKFFVGEPTEVLRRIEAGTDHLRPLRRFGALDDDVLLNFISPIPGAVTPGGITRETFLRSRSFSATEGGLNWLFQRQKEPMRFNPRVSAAVAVAGMAAHDTNRRRAVVLMTAGAVEDPNDFPPHMTRGYLEALDVPLYVWSFGEGTLDHAWQGAVDLGDPRKPQEVARRLAQATASLQRDLRKQRVVWLEGRHIPNQIALASEARGVRLAGALARSVSE